MKIRSLCQAIFFLTLPELELIQKKQKWTHPERVKIRSTFWGYIFCLKKPKSYNRSRRSGSEHIMKEWKFGALFEVLFFSKKLLSCNTSRTSENEHFPMGWKFGALFEAIFSLYRVRTHPEVVKMNKSQRSENAEHFLRLHLFFFIKKLPEL